MERKFDYFENCVETKIESLKLEFENCANFLIEKINEFETVLIEKNAKTKNCKKVLNKKKDFKIQLCKHSILKKINRQTIGSLSGLAMPIDEKIHKTTDEPFINFCQKFFNLRKYKN